MFAATALIGFMAFTTALTPVGKTDYYQESNAASTTTSGTYQDKTTLAFTPEDNSEYVICWTASIQGGTTSDVNAKLVNTTSSTDLSIVNIEAQDTLNWHNVGGAVRQTFGASPGSQTYKIQYSSEAAATVGIKDARIWAIRLDTLVDQYAASDADSTTTSTSLQDKTTLTWTPSTAGYYLILFMAEHNVNSTTNAAELVLDIDGTAYYTAQQVQQDTTNYRTWSGFKVENLSAASHTIKIQYRSPGGSTVTIRRARIVALRLDAFPNYWNAEQLTRQTTTNAEMNWAEELALNFTPQQKNCVMMISANTDYNGSSTQNFNIWDGLGPLAARNWQTPHSSGGSFTAQTALVGKATYGAGERSAKVQMAQSNTTGSADTVGVDEMGIAILEVGSKSVDGTTTNTSTNVNSTTYSDHLVLNKTPDASSTYLLLATTRLNGGISAQNARLRLQDKTGGTTLAETQCAMKNAADRMCFAMATLYTSSGSPASTDFAIQVASNGVNAATAYDSQIAMVKLGANDTSGSSTAESTTTSTSRQDKVSVGITPGSQGDYFIVMGADVGHSSTSSTNGVDTVIDVDGVEYKLTKTSVDGAADYKSILQIASVNLDTSAHTIKLRYNNAAASGTAKIRNAYIIIIRRSDWNATYWTEQNTKQTGGVAKDFLYIDAMTATHTLNAGAHLFIGVGNVDYSSVSRASYARVIDDALIADVQANEEPAATTNETPFFSFYRRQARAESLTITMNQTSDSAGSTSGADDIGLIALQVEA